MKFKNTQAKAKNDGKYKNINNIAFGLGRYTWRILYIRVFSVLSAPRECSNRNPGRKQRRQRHKKHDCLSTSKCFFILFYSLLPHLANETRQNHTHTHTSHSSTHTNAHTRTASPWLIVSGKAINSGGSLQSIGGWSGVCLIWTRNPFDGFQNVLLARASRCQFTARCVQHYR